VRASNTQPVLVLRFEARDRATLEEIQAIFMEKVQERLRA
jgi:phosphomannomutase/phosphoglucomutase